MKEDDELIKEFYKKSLKYSDEMLHNERHKNKTLTDDISRCNQDAASLYEDLCNAYEEKRKIADKFTCMKEQIEIFNKLSWFKKIFYKFELDDE